jgi:DNA-binding IclR family transcriptional regulator
MEALRRCAGRSVQELADITGIPRVDLQRLVLSLSDEGRLTGVAGRWFVTDDL